MNKLAVFVEGQTEQIFVVKLLEEIVGARNLHIEKRTSRGRKSGRRMHLLETHDPESEDRYFALIVDCGQDESVKSDIAERYDELVARGYQAIVGIRDVYPLKRDDIPKLRKGLEYKVKTNPIRVLFALGIMEVEVWFIAEHTHCVRIDPRLTTDLISEDLGFDPSTYDLTLLEHPAADLDDVYRLAGQRYNKKKAVVQRTVDVLDYASMYIELGSRFEDFKNLVNQLDRFLSPEPTDGHTP